MAQLAPQRRPHYPATERMAILELRAVRSWSYEQAAREFLVTAETICSWVGRIDEAGAKALVQIPQPVNNFPDCVRYTVQRLKVLCPSLGKVKIAQVLCRAATLPRQPSPHPPPAAARSAGRFRLRSGTLSSVVARRPRRLPLNIPLETRPHIRYRSGQPIRRADAQRCGHLSAVESQRLGVTDRLLSSTARRLRCSFSAARTGRTGRRLIGEFWPGACCSGAQFGPNPVTGEGFLARFPRNLGFLGRGETVATPHISATLRGMPFG
jgi:hypothetical protein